MIEYNEFLKTTKNKKKLSFFSLNLNNYCDKFNLVTIYKHYLEVTNKKDRAYSRKLHPRYVIKHRLDFKKITPECFEIDYNLYKEDEKHESGIFADYETSIIYCLYLINNSRILKPNRSKKVKMAYYYDEQRNEIKFFDKIVAAEDLIVIRTLFGKDVDERSILFNLTNIHRIYTSHKSENNSKTSPGGAFRLQTELRPFKDQLLRKNNITYATKKLANLYCVYLFNNYRY